MSLVASAVEVDNPWAGLGMAEDIAAAATAVGDGEWVAAGLSSAAAGLSLAGAIVDPFGTAASAGVGWIIEHLSPLKDWLQNLTGDPEEVAAVGQTWSNIAGRLESCATRITDSQQALAGLDGAFAAQYRTQLEGCSQGLTLLSGVGTGIATGFQIASALVQFVYELVRDAIADLIGKAAVWVAETALTLGLGTPWVLSQVATTVSTWVARLSSKVDDLLSSCGRLADLLDDVRTGAAHMSEFLASMGKGLRTGAGRVDDALTALGRGTRDAAGVTHAGETATSTMSRFLDNLFLDHAGTPTGRFWRHLEGLDQAQADQVTSALTRITRNNAYLSSAVSDMLADVANPAQIVDVIKTLQASGESELAKDLRTRLGLEDVIPGWA